MHSDVRYRWEFTDRELLATGACMMFAVLSLAEEDESPRERRRTRKAIREAASAVMTTQLEPEQLRELARRMLSKVAES